MIASELDWANVESAIDGVLDRGWYTNHGPMAQSLEARLSALHEVAAAVIVTNHSLGLIMLTEALGLQGEVILSALSPACCAQALRWAGLRPRFCDIDEATLGLAPGSAEAAIGAGTAAILVTPGCDPAPLAALAARHRLAFCRYAQPGRDGPGLVGLAACGDDPAPCALLTDDAGLAARLRNIRSSYGAGPPVTVHRTANGRVSELQAALALEALDRPCGAPNLPLRHLPFGQEIALLAVSQPRRDRLIARLHDAGCPAHPLVLDHRAVHCPHARSIAASCVLMPRRRAYDPAFVDLLAREAA